MEKMIASVIVGIVFIFISYFVGMRNQLGWLHSYHWVNIKPQDQIVYAKIMGTHLFVVGLDMVFLPVFSLLCGSQIGTYIVIGIACICILGMVLTTIKLNGSLFNIKL